MRATGVYSDGPSKAVERGPVSDRLEVAERFWKMSRGVVDASSAAISGKIYRSRPHYYSDNKPADFLNLRRASATSFGAVALFFFSSTSLA
jgi:hypothetical protein